MLLYLDAAANGQIPLPGWVTILVGLVTLGTVIAKAARWAGQMEQHLKQQDAAVAAQDKTLADQNDTLNAQNAALAALHTKLDALGGTHGAL